MKEVAAPANGQVGILPGNSETVSALVQVWEMLTVAHRAN